MNYKERKDIYIYIYIQKKERFSIIYGNYFGFQGIINNIEKREKTKC